MARFESVRFVRPFNGGGEGLLALVEEILGEHAHLGDLVVEDGVRGVGGDVHVAVVLVAARHAHLKQTESILS